MSDDECRICRRQFDPPLVARYGASSYCEDCVAEVTGKPRETAGAPRRRANSSSTDDET